MQCSHSQFSQDVDLQGTSLQVPRWKRVLDIVCILLAMPIILPIGLLIALIIKTVSRGPVFFHQDRIGHRGNKFPIVKFRTMTHNAATQVHAKHLEDLMTSNRPMTKLDTHDSRVIPFGRVLRAFGLDELPQLINVWKGQMSLVGPRPCLPYEYEKYTARHRGRCATLPGLTGLWQVSGKNRTTFEEMIDFDLDYCRTKTLWLDLKIMALTIPAIFGQVWDTLKRKAAARNAHNEQVRRETTSRHQPSAHTDVVHGK